MTVPYYAEVPYDPDKDGASLNNFDQNQKVELGTYTYKKNGAVILSVLHPCLVNHSFIL